jgi:pimeloyl-ACP methyl ester carboxylesterase
VSFARHKTAALLARWLGPWANDDVSPQGVTRTPELYGDDQGVAVRGVRYEPQDGNVTGTYLVAQGLHYEGADDPRMDRFCRVLAGAGFIVIAPMLTDFLSLEVTPRSTEELATACHAAVAMSARRGLPRPALFSISFGSLPAIEVAASDRFRDALGALVLFGGFFSFNASIRFAITKRAFREGRSIDVPHDPTNSPAVFINLVDHLPDAPVPDELKRAWLEMTRKTWGRPDLRPEDKRWPIAEAIAAELPEEARDLFLVGCGLRAGGGALLEVGLARAGDHFAFTDPSPHLARIAVPIVIGHGRDDDVIPYSEAQKLAEALPIGHRHRVHITGMYGHTGSAIPTPSELTAEAKELMDVLYSLVDAPHEALLG